MGSFMGFPCIYRLWIRIRYCWIGNLRCGFWYVTQAKKFAAFLDGNYGIVDLRPFKIKNWNPGCHCFTGRFTENSVQYNVFVKMGGVLELASREAKAILLVRPHLRNSLCVPRMIACNERPYFSFVSTSFVQGQSLNADIVLAEAKKSVGCEEVFIEELLRQMLDIIQALHAARVVHRDVRPDNLLLSCHPGTGLPQLTLIDFAMAVSSRENLPPLILKKKQEVFLAGLGEVMKPDTFVWDDAFSFYVIARTFTGNFRGDDVRRLLTDISGKIGSLKHSGLVNVLQD